MFKIIIAIRFRPDIPFNQCKAYWLEQHAHLALRVVGLERYVVSIRVSGHEDIGNALFDGYESLSFTSEAEAMRALVSPEMATLNADIDKLAELKAANHLLAEEIVMQDILEPAEAIKLVAFNHRRSDLTPSQFRDYWQNRHAPLVKRHFAALSRYVLNVSVPASYDATKEPDMDGLLEAWLKSFAALGESEGTKDHDIVRADEANFLDQSRFRFMLVRDHVFR